MISRFADHAANERTFLAWVRTVLAIVGLGIGIAHLKEPPDAFWSEFGLLVVGGTVIALCYVRARILERRINAADSLGYGSGVTDSLLLAIFISFFVLIGLFALHIS